MGSETSHFCDRCRKPVRRRADLRLFQAEVDYDVDKGPGGQRQPLAFVEVCADCAGLLASAVAAAMEVRETV